ncbi:MAG: hypothetical protein M3460_24680 [Actinomycetota bacterium]|nr:hypothetical protein [Actinomycetota bacterium]
MPREEVDQSPPPTPTIVGGEVANQRLGDHHRTNTPHSSPTTAAPTADGQHRGNSPPRRAGLEATPHRRHPPAQGRASWAWDSIPRPMATGCAPVVTGDDFDLHSPSPSVDKNSIQLIGGGDGHQGYCSGLQSLDQVLVPVLGQVRVQHPGVILLEGLSHPVRRGAANQSEHRCLAGLQLLSDAPDQIVIDPDVAKGTGRRTGCRAGEPPTTRPARGSRNNSCSAR